MSVEQAADRLRRWYAATCDDDVKKHEYDSDDEPEVCEPLDMLDVTHAYLDLFDPTPLTEEILRASGWEIPEGYSVYMRHPIAGGLFFEKHTGAYFEQFMGYARTVGDLRRLLSALHIDVEVKLP